MKNLHRLVGIAVAVPLLLWSLTGMVFLLKPGYEGAYEQLSPRTYSMPTGFTLPPDSNWLEIRLLRTVLGNHLIVRSPNGWQHLNPETLAVRGFPSSSELVALVEDSIAANPQRYGNVLGASEGVVTTDTGVTITLNWSQLAFTQKGPDTHLIDALYRIHYLQWLGDPDTDRLLGIAGLTLLIALFGTGVVMQWLHWKNKGSGAG